MPPPQPSSLATELRAAIVEHFDGEELRTLCTDLGVDYDTLPGLGKEAVVRELIAYQERRHRLPALLAACQFARPLVAWPAGAASEGLEAQPLRFDPLGSWQMVVDNGTTWRIIFEPDGQFGGYGSAGAWGYRLPIVGTWSYVTPWLRLQGSIGGVQAIMLDLQMNVQLLENSYQGCGNDGHGYTFTRVEDSDALSAH